MARVQWTFLIFKVTQTMAAQTKSNTAVQLISSLIEIVEGLLKHVCVESVAF